MGAQSLGFFAVVVVCHFANCINVSIFELHISICFSTP